METRVIGRGALAGLIAGVLGFVFAYIYAEPLVQAAIDYESGRHDTLNALQQAAGLPVEPDGPTVFDRTIQTTIGLATGIILVAVAMGMLCAVAFVLLRNHLRLRPQVLAWAITAFGFLGIYLLPFTKYPANPPAIGHTFTIQTRGALYLGTVALSLVLLAGAVLLARRLAERLGWFAAVLASVVAFVVVFGVITGLMPSLGNLQANVDMSTSLGFARAATETPQPITNVLNTPLSVNGIVYQPGQIVYPGFSADLLWSFRWCSMINQLIIWFVIAVVFGWLMERFFGTKAPKTAEVKREAVAV